MKLSLMDKLVCPECAGGLDLSIFRQVRQNDIDEVQDGALRCLGCGRVYVISHFVPRFLDRQLFVDRDFERRYQPELKALRGVENTPSINIEDQFKRLQADTIKNFGFEWHLWNEFGWGDEVSMDKTRKIFEYKVLMKSGDLNGKLVLDAGCGNGRYTAVASEYGGEVIGVDLSGAVDVAQEHLAHDPKVHIVQADLFKLPFKPQLFDFIFSNGVLMHTGNARRAFLSLTKLLKPDGSITVHLYHKGNPIYEFNDRLLRAITLRLPLNTTYQLSRALAAVGRLLSARLLTIAVNGFIRLETHPHYVFDWYTAPIATHHTYPEVYGWLKEADLHLVHDHNATKHPWRKWILPLLFLTVKAQKQPFSGEPLHTRE